MDAGIPRAISWLVKRGFRIKRPFPRRGNDAKLPLLLRLERKVVTGEFCGGGGTSIATRHLYMALDIRS